METYFDNREQREKTVPDCSKVGLTWNPETQRCELPMSFFSPTIKQTGMGFLDDGFDGSEYDFYDWETGTGYYYDGYGWSDDWGNYYLDSSGDGSADGYYEDSVGNWQIDYADGSVLRGGADGSLYGRDSTTGETWDLSPNGAYTWQDADGYSYYEDANGNWTSGNADGSNCSGDARGNWACSDGSTGGAWSTPAQRQQAQQRKAQAQAASGGGASGGGSSAAKQAAQQAQQRNQNPNLNPNAQGIFNQSDIKTLVYIGLFVGALMLIKK